MPPAHTEVTDKLLEIIQSAQKSIKIIQPYVQNVEEVESALLEAIEKRGVQVEIITARKRDQPIYQSFLNSDLFGELLKKGVKVYEEPYKYLHMKAVDIDSGRFLTIGSLNQDHCSFYQNNEANVLITGNGKTPEYRQFEQIYRNLRNESVLVDPKETYQWSSYLENKFWRFTLVMTRWVCMNREMRNARKKEN